MLHIKINSYDSQFDTFACTFTDDDMPAFESLMPATLVTYIAPELVAQCEDLPYDLVGREFTLRFPAGALIGEVQA